MFQRIFFYILFCYFYFCCFYKSYTKYSYIFIKVFLISHKVNRLLRVNLKYFYRFYYNTKDIILVLLTNFYNLFYLLKDINTDLILPTKQEITSKVFITNSLD
jgi:hypothetical protein